MRINEYNSFEDFYYEYAYGPAFSWEDENHIRRFMGIEFKYNGRYYRMCREPLTEEEYPVLPDGRIGLYDVMEMHCAKTTYPGCDYFETLGWYANLDDLLEQCYLQGKKFREVIMADETEILSQD